MNENIKKMKKEEVGMLRPFAIWCRRLLKRDVECVETSFSLLHVLLLLGGSMMASRVLLLQVEGALSLISE